MSYLLIAVPTDKTGKKTRDKLRTAVEKCSHSVSDFKIPALKVGTLDSLMQLSDELLKVDTFGEQVSKKIERCFFDMVANKPKGNPDDEKKHGGLAKKKKKKKMRGNARWN